MPRRCWKFFSSPETKGMPDSLVALSIDYDGCGGVFNRHFHPRVSSDTTDNPVVPLSRLRKRMSTQHDDRKRVQFWLRVGQAMEWATPDICMSGSARIAYQEPGILEQDGMDHVEVLSNAMIERGFPRIDPRALQRHPQRSQRLLDIHAKKILWPNEKEEVRTKMSIVCEQIDFIRRKHPVGKRPIRFVFVDDIHADTLMTALKDNTWSPPSLRGVELHLVHYQSYDDSTSCGHHRPVRVKKNVYFWEKPMN